MGAKPCAREKHLNTSTPFDYSMYPISETQVVLGGIQLAPMKPMETLLIFGVLVGVLTVLILVVLVSSAYKPKRKMRDWESEEDYMDSTAYVGKKETIKTIEERPKWQNGGEEQDEAPLQKSHRDKRIIVLTKKAKVAEAPVSAKEEDIEEKKLGDKVIEELQTKDQIAKKAKKVTKGDKKYVVWAKKRRTTIRTKLSKLDKKQFSQGLSQREETQKRIYEGEMKVIQKELFKNPAFLVELNKAMEWAIKTSKKGKSSKEIMKKLKKDKYSEREIEIISKAFRVRKEKVKKEE